MSLAPHGSDPLNSFYLETSITHIRKTEVPDRTVVLNRVHGT